LDPSISCLSHTLRSHAGGTSESIALQIYTAGKRNPRSRRLPEGDWGGPDPLRHVSSSCLPPLLPLSEALCPAAALPHPRIRMELAGRASIDSARFWRLGLSSGRGVTLGEVTQLRQRGHGAAAPTHPRSAHYGPHLGAVGRFSLLGRGAPCSWWPWRECG
jgi:hypothetical protein